jgi:hypothetical protein
MFPCIDPYVGYKVASACGQELWSQLAISSLRSSYTHQFAVFSHTAQGFMVGLMQFDSGPCGLRHGEKLRSY